MTPRELAAACVVPLGGVAFARLRHNEHVKHPRYVVEPINDFAVYAGDSFGIHVVKK